MSTTLRIDYVPLPWASQFHSDNWQWACLTGGLGSGKTTCAIMELLQCALENPGATYLIARKTLPSLRDTTMKSFFAIVPHGLIKDYNKALNKVTIINDTDFIFRPLDDKEKLKSLEIAGFFVDEANEIDKDTYDTLKSRVRQRVKGKPPSRYRGIISLNPVEEDHWIPQTFLFAPQSGHKHYQSTTLDNMTNLPPGYIAQLKATYTEDMQQRMIYGLYGKVHTGRPVFPQFVKGNYVASFDWNNSLPVVRGFDFGYNRPAVVWLQMEKDQIRVIGEVLGKEVYLEDFIVKHVLPYEEALFTGSNIVRHLDFCDPRGSDESDKGQSSVQILRKLGINPIFRRTWIEEGLDAIKTRLDTVNPDTRSPNFLIHPRCKILIEAFRGGYSREDGEDKPKKDGYYDNIMDACRYAILHCVQRSRINGLMKKQVNAGTVYVNKHTGRRLEL